MRQSACAHVVLLHRICTLFELFRLMVWKNPELLVQKMRELRAIAQIYPFAASSALFLMHALPRQDPVEALGTRQRRRQPDLLIGRLLVEDVRAIRRERDR